MSNMESIRKQFTEKLKPDEYNGMLNSVREISEDSFFHFWLISLNDIFKSRKFHGTHLLEIGSGATVHNIASASAYFPHIVQSDFVEANRIALRKWLQGGPDILDWSTFLDVVAETEGFSDLELGRREIEARIRGAVKSVVHCDVLDDQVIPPKVRLPYDVILTSLTLEAAAIDLKAYTEILKRLNRLLRPGGALIMLDITECPSWSVKENEFYYLSLTEDEITEALEEAGFGEIIWKFSEKTPSLPFEYKKTFTVTSVKL